MEIKQLRTFLAVANARSFLGAAATLYISRQAVSKTIAQLEDELNIELFVRNQNGAMMTPAGIFFYPRAAALVADFDKLMKEMQEINGSYRPKMQICMALGIYSLFARRLMEYAQIHRSEMELTIRGCLDTDCDTVLADRRADAVLSFTPQSHKTSRSTLLLESPIVFLVNKNNPLSHASGAELDVLCREPLLLYTGGREHCLWWPDAPRPRDVCCGDLDYLFALLQDDRGILPLPQIMIPPYLDFAEVLPGYPDLEPCRIYYSTLDPGYYDSLTYNLLGAVYKDVFTKREE